MQRALGGVLVVDGAVFLVSAAFNLGVRIPLGPVTLGFPSPLWQAAIGEILIGSGLITAARTGRAGHALFAAGAAALGIAFGLSSREVVGAARDIHVLLVPLTAFVFVALGLAFATRPRLVRTDAAHRSSRPGRVADGPAPIAVVVLTLVASAAYAAASVIHFGLVIPLGFATLRDPFPGAAAPEAVIATILLACAIAIARRLDGAWLAAVLGTSFSWLLTVYGLSISLRASRPGDVAYHLGVLGLLAVIVVLELLPANRRALDRRHEAKA